MEKETTPSEKNPAYIERAKTHKHVPWCDEYEKLLCGIRTRALGVPVLDAHLVRTRRLCQQFNNEDIPADATLSSLMAKSYKLIAEIVGHIGQHSRVRPPFKATFGCNLWIGDNVTINEGASVADAALVRIGSRALIGPSCYIGTGNHSMNHLDRRRPDGTARPVEIGEDTWLGAGVIVLGGVTIGEGAVVAAGAVVNRDVAPFTLVGGVPAKFIRKLDREEERQEGGKAAEKENGVGGGEGKDDLGFNALGGASESHDTGMGRGMDAIEDDLPRWLREPRK